MVITTPLDRFSHHHLASRSRCKSRRSRCRRIKNHKRSLHSNQQFSITAITDGSGAIVERYAYTACGTPTITDASGTLRTTTVIGNRYTYTGRELDETLALYHHRARMYGSVAGRFVSRDPIGFRGGRNIYKANFVVAKVDPLVLKCGTPGPIVAFLQCIAPSDVGKRRAVVSSTTVSPGDLNPDETENAINTTLLLLLISMIDDVNSVDDLTNEMLQTLINNNSGIEGKANLIMELKKLQNKLFDFQGVKGSIWIRYNCQQCKEYGWWNKSRRWEDESEQLMKCDISKTSFGKSRNGRFPVADDDEIYVSAISNRELDGLKEDCECQAIASCESAGQPFDPNW